MITEREVFQEALDKAWPCCRGNKHWAKATDEERWHCLIGLVIVHITYLGYNEELGVYQYTIGVEGVDDQPFEAESRLSVNDLVAIIMNAKREFLKGVKEKAKNLQSIVNVMDPPDDGYP